jgi:hypothetical protein
MQVIRRRAWWVLFGISIVIALLAVGDIVVGAAFEPEGPLAVGGRTLEDIAAASPEASRVLDFRARLGGVDLLALGLLLAIVTWFPYRAGQRWSWGAMWVLPGWAASFVVVPLLYGLAPGQSLTAAMLSGPILALLAAAALVVDAGRFSARRVAGS